MLTTGQPLVTAYGYDAAGQERTQSIVSGTIPLTTTLDNEGRATTIVEGIAGSGPYTTSYGYTLDDQPVSMTLPGSVQQGWGYDGDGRLITQTLAGPTGVSTPLTSTYGYSYTATGWTDGVTSTLSGITATQLITHDAQGRLTAASGGSGGTSQSWSYDGNGNLLSAVITTTGGTTTTSYGYTQASTPNAVLTVTTPGQPTTYYGYDQHGDTTSITNGGTLSTAIQYDGQARPITITLQDGTQATLGYNADGLRASYTVSKGGTTSLSERFQYRDGELAQAIVVSGTQSYTDTYVYAPSGAPLELLRTTPSGSTSRYWYQVDGRGNVVALTDATGNVVDRYSYDLWGYPTTISESVPQQLRYGGYWWDAQLGWYWVSVRYYDPALERWLQPDPSEQDGVHTYVYVGDDPVDATDPTGLEEGGGPCADAAGPTDAQPACAGGDEGGTSGELGRVGGNGGSDPHAGGGSDTGTGDGDTSSSDSETTRTSETSRDVPGRATGGYDLPRTSRLLRGSNGNAGRIPGQIAARLRGRWFQNFNDFRKAFWKEVARDADLAKGFSKANIARMAKGLAPRVESGQQVGQRLSYELHHVTPVQHGGGLYDMDNIVIVTPRFHQAMLDPRYHY